MTDKDMFNRQEKSELVHEAKQCEAFLTIPINLPRLTLLVIAALALLCPARASACVSVWQYYSARGNWQAPLPCAASSIASLEANAYVNYPSGYTIYVKNAQPNTSGTQYLLLTVCPNGDTYCPTLNWGQTMDDDLYAYEVWSSSPSFFCLDPADATIMGIASCGSPSFYAKLQGDCACKYSNATSSPSPGAGDPINIASGNMNYSFTDYSTAGQNALSFVRYYNSAINFNEMAYSLGNVWRTNYDRFLGIGTNAVTAERQDGQTLTFLENGSLWSPDSDVDLTLSQTGSGVGSTWTLTDHNDVTETYDQISATEAVVTSIRARNGYTQTIAYNSSNQAISVTDSYNRTLTFGYVNALLASVTTPDGTTISFSYQGINGNALLSSVVYSSSPQIAQQFAYDPNTFALLSIYDEDGSLYASWTYDQYGRGLSSQLGQGANLTKVAYNDTTGNRTVTNALEVTDTYMFSSLQGVPKVTHINRAPSATTAAATETFSYDANGYLARTTDWNGNQTQYVNNGYGMPTQIVEAYGSPVARTTTIAYDPTWVRLPQSIATPGLTVTSTYDGYGELLTRMETDTTTTSSPYSTKGQTRTWTYAWQNSLPASVINPRNFKTSFGYDASGALISITDALAHVTHITSHTPGGLPLTVVDPNNVTTTLTYSPRQWLLSSSVATSAGARTTNYQYDPAGNLIQTTLPDGSYSARSYDSAHRLIGESNADGDSIAYQLDSLGDRIFSRAVNSGNANSWQHFSEFDSLGRVLMDEGGAGQMTTFTYDPNGNMLTSKDGLNHVTTRSFDALNRLQKSTDANGGVTLYAYNAHDKLVSLTDPNGNATSWVRDGFDEAIEQLSPDTGATVYHFDGESNLTQKLDAAGVVTNRTFDGLDRVLTTSYPVDTTENVAYTYDQTGHGFGIGRLTSLTDAAGSLSRTYDERGNRLTEKRTLGSKSYLTTYRYTPGSLVVSVTYPSGSTVTYTRDPAARINAIASQAPSASAVNLATNITYAPFGPVTGTTAFNGDSEAFTFDTGYRLRKLINTATNAPQQLTFNYDEANNVTGVNDAVCSICSSIYYYDALNRLQMAKGWYGNYSYWFDKNGNMIGNGLANSQNLYTGTYSYQAGTNRLSSIYVSGFSYPVSTNANGNITNFTRIPDETTTLTYNRANRLATSSTAWQAASYAYDAFGQRFSKTDAGSPATLFFYDLAGHLIEEVDNGTYNDYVWMDDRLIGTLVPSTNAMSFIHVDRLGSPISATDAKARLSWMLRYMPYGGPSVISSQASAATITQNLRFPGQYADPETLLNHNGWRDFSPALGRYIEADPIGLEGGMNPYSYGYNNPPRFADPTGLVPDLNLNPPGSAEFSYAKTIPSRPGYFTLTGHSVWPEGALAPTGFAWPKPDTTGGFTSKTPEGLASWMLANQQKLNYTPGEPVILVVCGAGISPGNNQPSIAARLSQTLSARSGVPTAVWGANNNVWLNGQGGYASSPTYPWDNAGQFTGSLYEPHGSYTQFIFNNQH